MAQKLLGRIGAIGVGLAIAGGVAQSALYNGNSMRLLAYLLLITQWFMLSLVACLCVQIHWDFSSKECEEWI